MRYYNKDLKASRDYRAFAGLSAGGMVTWQAFLDNSDIISKFIPLSGFIGNMYDENDYYIIHEVGMTMAESLAASLVEQGLDYQIIECCGTEDEQMTESVEEQFDRFRKQQDLFGPEHYKVIWVQGEGHSGKAFDDGFYSALPMIFPTK